MRRLIAFGLGSVVICGLLLASSLPAGVAEAVDSEQITEGAKAAAMRRLEELAVSQSPDSTTLLAEVSANCEAFTTTQLADALKQADNSRKNYGELASTSVISLEFVINNLRQTAQDASAVIDTRDELVGLETDFTAATWAYIASLEDLAALGEDCAYYPILFAAGLRQARLLRLEAVHYAEAVLQFVEADFANVLADVREQAEEDEQNG